MGSGKRRISSLLGHLDSRARGRYDTLAARCHAILDQQSHGGDVPEGLEAQREGLSRLLWMYLRSIVARQTVEGLLREAEGGPSLDRRVADLESQISRKGVSDDLRRSLAGQLDILRQRQTQQGEAEQEARVPRCRARAHSGAGGADSRASCTLH